MALQKRGVRFFNFAVDSEAKGAATSRHDSDGRGSMEGQTFFLGAFVYPGNSPEPSCGLRPVIAEIYDYTPYLAKRLLIWEGYFAREIRLLPDA